MSLEAVLLKAVFSFPLYRPVRPSIANVTAFKPGRFLILDIDHACRD